MDINDFNKKFSGILEIEMSEPTVSVNGLANQRSGANAGIKKLSLSAEVYEEDADSFRSPTNAELDEVVLERPTVTLRSFGHDVEHVAPDGKRFTARDLLMAVEETERRTRSETEWFGGIDVHHVFFEGLHEAKDGALRVSWGS